LGGARRSAAISSRPPKSGNLSAHRRSQDRCGAIEHMRTRSDRRAMVSGSAARQLRPVGSRKMFRPRRAAGPAPPSHLRRQRARRRPIARPNFSDLPGSDSDPVVMEALLRVGARKASSAPLLAPLELTEVGAKGFHPREQIANLSGTAPTWCDAEAGMRRDLTPASCACAGHASTTQGRRRPDPQERSRGVHRGLGLG
jgi:hypothetical protein